MVREVRRARGYDAENVVNAALMAWTGSPRQVVLAIADGANAVGFGGVASSAVAAVAATEVAAGSYRAAYERLKPLIHDPFLHVAPTYFPDFVEAARRSGHQEEAAKYAGDLVARAAVNGSAWCRGVAERSMALTSPDDEAEDRYRAAIDTLGSTRAEIELGRAHLLYGEWLRRMKRRREAAEQLRQALDQFERSGAEVFLPRTRNELDAAGAKAEPPTPRSGPDLTTQEATVARLAATGHTNSEIAANLFISPNTVDYHLRKVFQKYGISSRRQLADKLMIRQ